MYKLERIGAKYRLISPANKNTVFNSDEMLVGYLNRMQIADKTLGLEQLPKSYTQLLNFNGNFIHEAHVDQVLTQSH